jgi:hypothetical protein
MAYPARLLREPLLHFMILGGLVFLLYGAVSEPGAAPRDTIVIDPERRERLAQGFEAVWGRAPTDDELRAIVDEFIREEVYYREALSLGLDRDDTVIRQRLRQKMEFLTDTGVDLLTPVAGELEAYLTANDQAFRSVSRVAFEQVYLGVSPSPERIAESLRILRSGAPDEMPAVGERTLLPAQLSLSPPDAVDGVFGEGFFAQLANLPVEAWSGPVESGYGVHVVRILRSVPGRLPTLEEAHDAVLREWKASRAAELREQLFERLRDRYVVERRGGDAGAGEQR